MSPTLCGILSLVIFCFGSVLVMACLQVMPPFQLGFIIFVIGFSLMSAYEFYLGKSLITPWKQDLQTYIGAVSGVGGYTVIIYTAFRLEAPFEVNVLNYLWPIFIVVFSMIVKHTAINAFQISGSILGFMGMMLLFITPGQTAFLEGLGIGHVLAVLAAAVWAIYSIWAKGRHYPTSFMGPVMLLSALLCLAGHVVFEEAVMPDLRGLALILILGVSRVSYVLWDLAMRRGDTLLLTSLSYFIPLASTLMMIAFGFKPDHAFIGFGGALIILGCLVVNADKIVKLFRRKAVVV